jgi:hypothetical protein
MNGQSIHQAVIHENAALLPIEGAYIQLPAGTIALIHDVLLYCQVWIQAEQL